MSYNVGPHTVGIQLSSNIEELIERAIELGVFAGPVGNMTINPSLQPLMDAIVQVLAGGAVTVQVTQPGTPAIVNELNKLLSDGMQESNDINKKAGYYVTLAA
jgi:hypothetical protein